MRVKSKLIPLVLLMLLGLATGTIVLAQSAASFDLNWHVIGSGGGVSSSASYRLNGTIGQSIASQPTSGSASFTVSSGYWLVDAGYFSNTGQRTIYLPLLLKNHP